MLTGMCPECDALIRFTSMPKTGHRVVCPNCRSMLIVISSHPIKLDWAFVEPIDTSNPEDGREFTKRSN
jgi:uncharacterized paraquat-inducible protein A